MWLITKIIPYFAFTTKFSFIYVKKTFVRTSTICHLKIFFLNILICFVFRISIPSLAIVKHITSQKDRTRVCNVTLWGVCLTRAAKERQQCVFCVLLSYMSLSTIHNIIKFSVVTGTQHLIYVTFLSSYKVFRTARYSCSISNKLRVSRHIFIAVSNIIYHEIPNIGSRVDICGEMDGRLDGQADRQT